MTSSQPHHIDALDGLRAIAVGCVVITHYAGADSVLRKVGVDWALIGVHIFFVLSGFLITKLLIEKYFKDGSFFTGFGAFLAARTFRIVPLAYAVIALVYILAPDAIPDAFVRDNLSFTSNLYTARTGLWFPYVGHFWSLAVEMQFYIAYPLFVWVFRRRLTVALMTGIVGLLVIQAATRNDANFADPRFLLTTRADAFLWGGILFSISRMNARVLVVRGMLFVGGLIFTVQSIGTTWFAMKPLLSQMTVGNVFFAGIVGAALQPASSLSPFLRASYLRYLGKISFGIYIWHPIMWLIWANTRDCWHGLPYKLLDIMPLWMVLTVSTLAFAQISWMVLEKPANRIGHSLSNKILTTRSKVGIASQN